MKPSLDERFDNWTVQMRKGLLDYCILRALEGGECYGYALVKMLVAIPGIGVAEGSIYPLLSRLKKQGLVTTRLEESTEGPARKYYRLTDDGRLLAREMDGYFTSMTQGVEQLGVQDFSKNPSASGEADASINDPGTQ
ncbi:PadR family transcriptional regulator [Haloferula sargassicola]|uniref:Transcription regulator PadR N-terminal domain-containing protein n=1 Tax=Haloferula sargassicola TaxID=490096 RepID=A0ABP9UL11_9BACT